MSEGKTNQKSLGIMAIAGVEPYQEQPNEEYMNENQIAHFRKILEAWRDQLRNEVDRMQASSVLFHRQPKTQAGRQRFVTPRAR